MTFGSVSPVATPCGVQIHHLLRDSAFDALHKHKLGPNGKKHFEHSCQRATSLWQQAYAPLWPNLPFLSTSVVLPWRAMQKRKTSTRCRHSSPCQQTGHNTAATNLTNLETQGARIRCLNHTQSCSATLLLLLHLDSRRLERGRKRKISEADWKRNGRIEGQRALPPDEPCLVAI